MGHVNSFRELDVYKLARKLSIEIYEQSKNFPIEEKYSLTNQIRRSSRSVGARIAEAWAKRRYEKHFVSKLTDADGEQLETQHWIETALDSNVLTLDLRDDLIGRYETLGKKLCTMIEKAHLFCSRPSITDY